MSDIDEMELDEERPVDVPISFSSEAKGKKMSKANLPVSAGDTLPWFEQPLDVRNTSLESFNLLEPLQG